MMLLLGRKGCAIYDFPKIKVKSLKNTPAFLKSKNITIIMLFDFNFCFMFCKSILKTITQKNVPQWLKKLRYNNIAKNCDAVTT